MTHEKTSAGLQSLSIGGATFDLFVFTDALSCRDIDGTSQLVLPLGHKVKAREVNGVCGGGACNTSVGFARLGFDAGFCGLVGDDQWGTILVENFQKEGVRTDHLTVIEDETTSFSIIFTAKSGERVIIYDTGTNAHLHHSNFDREAVGHSDVVYLNHLPMQGAAISDDIIEILAKADKVRLTWNPGGRQIHAGLRDPCNRRLLEHTAVLQLNKEEAMAFSDASDVTAALQVLQEAGAKVVCITDGPRGSWAIDVDGRRYHCPVAPAQVVDTTGAGDAFGVGITWGLAQGHDLPTAMAAGTMNAASVVGKIGAQAGLLTTPQMEDALRSTHLDIATSTA